MKSDNYKKDGIRVLNTGYFYEKTSEQLPGVHVYRINADQINIFYNKNENYMEYIKNGNQITDEGNEFVNGFKIVKTKNGQALYVKEENNLIIPYIFDIATNFNEYGLAMVAKDAKVSWINKDFKYITKDGTVTDIPTIGKFNGWDSITCFSEGELKVSKCTTNGINAFMDTDMKLREFYDYNDINKEKEPVKWFGLETSEFADREYTIAQNGKQNIKLLLSNGYYIEGKTLVEKYIRKECILQCLVNYAINAGIPDEIKEDLDQKVYKKN